MNEQRTMKQTTNAVRDALPTYEPPRIQVMTERDILNTFQITQSMATWWTTSCC